MKKIFFYIVIGALLSSCTKDITSLNVDPKNPQSVSSTALFTNSQHELVDVLTNSNVNSNIYRLITQQWQETTYIDESQYDITTRNIPDNIWRTYNVDILKGFNSAKVNLVNESDKDEVTKRTLNAIIDIHEVYTWFYLITTYGNVPYTEAMDVSKTFPKYDDAMTIYKDLLVRTSKDITDLQGGTTISGIDAIYDGNAEKWRKFAASLKLKLAITIADVDAALAKTAAEEAVSVGVFTSNDDNAKFAYSTITPNTNPIWVDLVQSGRLDFVACSTLINQLLSNGDPRLPFYFTKDAAGGYSGGEPGKASPYANFSHAGIEIIRKDFPGNILDFSEVSFLLAEANERGFNVGGTAITHYNNGITASILDWGGRDVDVAAYLLKPSVNYLTASGDWKQKIGVQKWIALYNRGTDAWIEQRRLDFPALKPAEDASAAFPIRYTYPVNEGNTNRVNRDQAATAIGGDLVTTRLFFDKF